MSSSTMKVTVVSRKLIKPGKPTPSHLKTYKISLMDQHNPIMHITRILFYPSSTTKGKDLINLEKSLAQVLPLFYPLAGRYNKEKYQVDCNDEGAEYLFAEVDSQLDQHIEPDVMNAEQRSQLLPLDIGAVDEPTDPILAVQVNRFQCGGLAIGICCSHRIFDSYSFGIFLTAWANTATDGRLVITPDFDSSALFPSEKVAPAEYGVSRIRDKSIVCKRFVFDKNSISRLRESVSAEWGGERLPSRVLLVSALLTQAVLRSDRAKHGKSRASLIAQTINIRERTIPPLPKYSCGTWVSESYLEFTANQTDTIKHNYQEIVVKSREAMTQSVKDCSRILSDKEFGRWVLVDSYIYDAAPKVESPDYRTVWIADLTKFGDYELDFGFGKPLWTIIGDVPLQDLIILMNTKNNDGIEAWVCLHESDMEYFEQDKQLISFISNYHNKNN